MTSILASAPFERVDLTYSVRGTQSGADALGNPIYNQSTGTLTAFVSPFKAAHLHREPGADPKVARVKIELVSPLALPAGVGLGSVLTLTWNGKPASITITSIIPNDLIGVAFGTYMEGDMT